MLYAVTNLPTQKQLRRGSSSSSSSSRLQSAPSSNHEAQRRVVVPAAVNELLLRAGITESTVLSCSDMKEQDGGFCNQLYRVVVFTAAAAADDSEQRTAGTATTTTTLIAKVFSRLAMRRIPSVSDCLKLHEWIGNNRLGPRVVQSMLLFLPNNSGITSGVEENDGDDGAAARAALLMQEFKGRILTEADLHAADYSQSEFTRNCLQSTAIALSRLHQLGERVDPTSPPAKMPTENMLFHACEVMLSLCDNVKWDHAKPVGWNDNLEELRAAFEREKGSALAQLGEDDMVWTGHGDLKPSNVMIAHGGEATDGHPRNNTIIVQFIDLELAGLHYRSFDLAKLFRTDTPTVHTAKNRRYFLEVYADACHNNNNNNNNQLLRSSLKEQIRVSTALLPLNPDVLELQVEQMLPITWLEAAIFFVCMTAQSASKKEAKLWHELALKRLVSYEASLQMRGLEA